jgi:hypothetical protein
VAIPRLRNAFSLATPVSKINQIPPFSFAKSGDDFWGFPPQAL